MKNLINLFKNVKVQTFTIAIAWTIIYLFAGFHNSSNKRFAVTQFQGTELQKGTTQVQISPALAWDEAKGLSRTVSFVFLLIMWLMFIIAALDLHLRLFNDEKSIGKTSSLMVWVPMLISFAFFLGNYSSIQQSNYMEIPKAQFIQWEQERKIEQKGAQTWIDKDDDKVMANLFLNRELIK